MDAASSLRAPGQHGLLRLRLTPVSLVLAIAVVALLVRLIGLEARPLWLDESYSAWFAARSWHILWTKVPTYEPHPPFYYSLLKLWREAFGASAPALRSFSVLLGVATVPLVAAAAAELERQRPTGRLLLRAGIAAFLAACSPMLVLLGQEARPYPLLIFAYALGSLGVLRLIREFAAGSPGEWRSWLMLGIGTELGLWAHGLGLLYAISLACALAPSWVGAAVSRQRLLRSAAATLAVGLTYLPCLLMIVSRAGDWRGNGWLSWKPIMMLQLLSLYAIPVEVLTIGSAVAALVIILLGKRAVQNSIELRGWNPERALLVMWWGPPILAILISQFAIPVFLPRTLAATLIPAYLLIADALVRGRSERERLLLSAALVITLVPTSLQAALRPSTEAWDEVVAYLDHHVQPNDQIWLYPNDSALPLEQAGESRPMRGIPGDYPAVGIKGPIRAGSPAVVSLTKEQAFLTANDRSLTFVPTIWLVTRQSALFDPRNDLPNALARVRRPGPMQQWGYINVRPYYRR